MKRFLIYSSALLSIVLISAVVIFSSTMKSPPLLIRGITKEVDAQTTLFMDAVCAGDYSTAESMLEGDLQFTLEREHSNALYRTLWNAYINTMSYEFLDSCYADSYGLYRDVTVTVLDIPTLMGQLQSRSSFLLAKNEDEHIMDILAENAKQLIAENTYTATRTFTLQIISRSGQWLILPTSQLIDVMQGSMGGE